MTVSTSITLYTVYTHIGGVFPISPLLIRFPGHPYYHDAIISSIVTAMENLNSPENLPNHSMKLSKDFHS